MSNFYTYMRAPHLGKRPQSPRRKGSPIESTQRKALDQEELIHFAGMVFGEVPPPESDMTQEEWEDTLARTINRHSAEIRNHLVSEDRRARREYTFDWNEFAKKYDIPEHLIPFIDGTRNHPDIAPPTEKAAERWKQREEELREVFQRISMSAWTNFLKEKGVAPQHWIYALNPSSIPQNEAGNAIRGALANAAEIHTSPETSNTQVLAPKFLDAHFVERERPRGFPPRSQEFSNLVNARGGLVNHGLLQFVRQTREAIDSGELGLRDPQVKAFADFWTQSLALKAFRKTVGRKDQSQYENALWALVSSGVLSIKRRGVRPSDVTFVFNRNSVSILENQIRAFIFKRDVGGEINKPLPENLIVEDSKDSQKQSKHARIYQQAIEDLKKRFDTFDFEGARGGSEHVNTLVEMITGRMYVTPSHLPTDPKVIEEKIKELEEKDIDAETDTDYAEEWRKKVDQARNILAESRNPSAQAMLGGILKLTGYVSSAHGRFVSIERNVEVISEYNAENDWSSVIEDGMLRKEIENLRNTRAFLVSKILRIQSWKESQENNPRGWQPVITLLGDLRTDADEVLAEGARVEAEIRSAVKELDPNTQAALFAPPETTTVDLEVIRQNEPTALLNLKNVLAAIAVQCDAHIAEIIKRPDLTLDVRKVLEQAFDAEGMKNPDAAQEALDALTKTGILSVSNAQNKTERVTINLQPISRVGAGSPSGESSATESEASVVESPQTRSFSQESPPPESQSDKTVSKEIEIETAPDPQIVATHIDEAPETVADVQPEPSAEEVLAGMEQVLSPETQVLINELRDLDQNELVSAEKEYPEDTDEGLYVRTLRERIKAVVVSLQNSASMSLQEQAPLLADAQRLLTEVKDVTS